MILIVGRELMWEVRKKAGEKLGSYFRNRRCALTNSHGLGLATSGW